MRKYFIVSSVGTCMPFQRLHNCFAQLFEEKIGMPLLKGNQIRTVSNSTTAILQGFLCNSCSLDSYNAPFAAIKLIPLRNPSEFKDKCSCISTILNNGFPGYRYGLEDVTRLCFYLYFTSFTLCGLSMIHMQVIILTKPNFIFICVYINNIYFLYIK